MPASHPSLRHYSAALVVTVAVVAEDGSARLVPRLASGSERTCVEVDAPVLSLWHCKVEVREEEEEEEERERPGSFLFAMGLEVQRAPMEAWYMDDSTEDQRKPHHRNPPEYVSEEKLAMLGVTHWVLDADNYETDSELQQIRKERGYNYEDIIEVSPERLPNYETKIKNFFEEHIHTDEEIRYCLDGSGYFDVRDPEDRWIRISVQKGDMIVLPAGCYHRFTLDENNYIKAMRLFVGEPIWTPYNRPQDEHPVRKDYIHHFLKSQLNKLDVGLST